MGFNPVHCLGDQGLTFIMCERRHHAAIAFILKSLGGTPNRRQKARLKLALF
jgi:hypothetical protein